MTRAYLSLGSNAGDRRQMLEQALARLEASGQVTVLRQSSLYETEPVGKTDQPWFYNLVAEIQTRLTPHELLDLAQAVERDLGRTRDVRWGPRTVDIDIVLYGGEQISTPRLAVPHPEMARRRFVLLPLVEIAPDLALPDGRRVDALLRDLQDQEVRRVAAL
jgi:2-amino-4-hydroxy-6-hydroxymethyldihydropteridine diphosphokinase